MKLLITGGTGLLGRALVALAASRGDDVVSTFLGGDPSGLAGRCLALDLRARGAAEALVAEVRPEVVIHTAYVQSGPDLRAITVEGSAAVARAAQAAGARLVHLSTDVLYDGAREGAYTEDDPLSPITDYGRAKADAESAVLSACDDAVGVRTSLLYTLAPEDRQAALALDLAAGRRAGALFTDEIRCPLLVDELAAALLTLVALPYRGRLNVVGPDAVSRHALGRGFVRLHGGDPDALPAARSADRPERRPLNCALSCERARGLLPSLPRGVFEVFASAEKSLPEGVLCGS